MSASKSAVVEPPRRRRTQQERSSEAERRLLAAAAHLIARKGAGGVTLAEVGAEAGYSRGIVYHHFGSKAALLNRLVATSRQRYLDRLDESAAHSGLDGLLGLLSAWVGSPTRMDDFARAYFVMWAEASARPGELRDAYIAEDGTYRALLARMIAAGVKDGSIRSDIDPQSTAISFSGHLHGVILQAMLDPDAPDIPIDKIRRTMVASWRRTLSADSAGE